MGYVATQPLPWGDTVIATGDPVPADEPGRDYAGMLYLGQIRPVDDTAGASDSELRKRLKEAEGKVRDLEGAKPDGPHLVLTLTDEQAGKLADLGLGGTVSFDDLDQALASADDENGGGADADANGAGDDLPEGVVAKPGGWYQLPDGVTDADGKDKVRGRDALAAVLDTAPAS
jgi:hypothetical protein